ncbi:pks1 [Symbiodinium sp. CCMP2456]|nr:pks1 [Symbiodinium sp. CCMP2456]
MNVAAVHECLILEVFLTEADSDGIDVVMNSLHQDDYLYRSLALLRKGGRFIDIGTCGTGNRQQILQARPDVQYHQVEAHTMMSKEPWHYNAYMQRLISRIEQGGVNPMNMQVFCNLQSLAKALQCLERSQSIGQVVMTQPSVLSLKPQSDYVLSGGMGAHAIAIAQYLMEEGAKSITLLSKSGRPSPSVVELWQSLNDSSVQLHAISCDIAMMDDVHALGCQLRSRETEIAGLFHLAEATDDAVVPNVVRDHLERSFSTTVWGARHLNLLKHGAATSWDFSMLVSFGSSLLTAAGQASNAAACAALDGQARYWKKALGQRVISVQWSSLKDEVGMVNMCLHPRSEANLAVQLGMAAMAGWLRTYLRIFSGTDLHKRAGSTSMTGHALDLAAINQLPGLKHHIRYVGLDEYQMYFRLRYDFIVREKQWLPDNPNEVDVEMVDALPDVHHLLVFTKDELGQPLQLIGSLRLGFTAILEHTLAGSRSMQQFLTTSDRLQLQKFFQQGDVLEVSRLCVTKDADAAERKDAMMTAQLISVFSKTYCTPSPRFVLFQAFQHEAEIFTTELGPGVACVFRTDTNGLITSVFSMRWSGCKKLCPHQLNVRHSVPFFTAFDIAAMSDVDDDIKKRSTSRNAVQEGLSWKDIAWLMLSDIVGTSVLTLNGVAAKLGWVLTITFIGGLFPVALYSSLLMSRTRGILSRMFGADKTVGLGTMGEIAACVFDSQRAGQIVIIIVYGYTALGQASYMLVMGRALQMSLYDLPLCLPAAVLLTIVALVVPIFGVRKLSESVPLAFFNSLLIVAVIVLALYRAGSTTPPCPHTFYFDPGLSGMVVLGAATNVVYSYAGQWMYFELMDTMAAPEDFPKSFSIAGPFMLISYLAVACLGYGFGSGSGDLIAGMPHGPMLQAAAAMLFIHVLIVYLIKSVVLVHFLHGCWKPNQVDARGLRSYVQHGGLGVLLLLMGFVVSNMVPFFSQLLGIIGGLFAGPIGFLFPITFFLLARGREVLAGREEHESLPMELQASSEEVAMCGGDDDKEESTETSSSASYETELGGGRCRYLVIGFNSLPLWERTTIVGTVLFIVATMVFGVADEVFEVIEMWDRLGAPFQCHHLQPPSPSCSADVCSINSSQRSTKESPHMRWLRVRLVLQAGLETTCAELRHALSGIGSRGTGLRRNSSCCVVCACYCDR